MISTDVLCFRLGEDNTETDAAVVAVETPGKCSHIHTRRSRIFDSYCRILKYFKFYLYNALLFLTLVWGVYVVFR